MNGSVESVYLGWVVKWSSYSLVSSFVWLTYTFNQSSSSSLREESKSNFSSKFGVECISFLLSSSLSSCFSTNLYVTNKTPKYSNKSNKPSLLFYFEHSHIYHGKEISQYLHKLPKIKTINYIKITVPMMYILAKSNFVFR